MLSPFIIVPLVLLLLFNGSIDAARIRGRDGRRWQQIPNNSADSVNQQIEAQQIAAEHERHQLDHHHDEREEEDDPVLLEVTNNSKAKNQMKDSAKLKAMDIGAHADDDDPPIEHNRNGHDGIQRRKDDPMLLEVANNNSKAKEDEEKNPQISSSSHHQNVQYDEHRDPMLEESEQHDVLVKSNGQKSALGYNENGKNVASHHGAIVWHNETMERAEEPMLLEVVKNSKEQEEKDEQQQQKARRRNSVHADVASVSVADNHHHDEHHYRDPMLLEVANNSKEKEEKQQNVRRNNTNGDGVAIARDPMLDEAERQVQGVVRNSKGQKTGASDHGAIGWHNETMERADPMEVENNSKSEEYERQQQKARRRNVAHTKVVSVSVADDHYHDEHRDPMLEEAERRPVVVYRRRQKSGITIIGSTNEANVNASDDAIVGGSNNGANCNQDQGMMAAFFDSSVSSSSPVTRKQKIVDEQHEEEPEQSRRLSAAIVHDKQQQALFRQPGAPLKKRKHHPALMTTSVYAREAAGSTEKKRYKAARKNAEPPPSSSSSSYHDDAMDDSDSDEEAEAAVQKERQNPLERKKFTEVNVRILQESFNKQKYLEDAEWLRLREETGLRLKQIGDWFKNARQRKAKNMAAEEQVERRDYDKTNFTESQLRTLTDAFDKHQGGLEDNEWIKLSQELDVRLQVIAKWFANARQKTKDGATKKWEYKQKNKCVLQASFDKQNWLEDAEWTRLREETGLRLKQIGDWFKNARQSKAKNSAVDDEQIFLKRKNFRKQTKFTEAQKRTLRKSFAKQNYLEDEEWIRLSQATGLRLKMIEDCFHNARYKQKPEQSSADEQEGTAKKRKSKAMRKNTKSPAVKRNKIGTSDIAKTSHRKGRKKQRRKD